MWKEIESQKAICNCSTDDVHCSTGDLESRGVTGDVEWAMRKSERGVGDEEWAMRSGR